MCDCNKNYELKANNTILSIIIEGNMVNCMESFMNINENIDFTFNSNEAIEKIITNKRHELFNQMVDYCRNQHWTIIYIINICIINDWLDGIKLIFNVHGFKIKSSFGTHAVKQSCTYGSFEITKFLVENGVEFREFHNGPNGGFERCIFSACERGHYKIVKFLIENGANVYQEFYDVPQNHCLYFAIQNGHYNIVKFLHEKYNDNVENDYFSSAVFTARRNGHTKLVNYLMNDTNFTCDECSKKMKIDHIIS